MSTPKVWFSKTLVDDIYRLSAIDEIGPAGWQKIYQSFDNCENFLKAGKNVLSKLLSDKQLTTFTNNTDVSKIHVLAKKHDIKYITIDDKKYPEILREIVDPPLWLFYKGDLGILKNNCFSVVGTRKPTPTALIAMKKVINMEIASKVTIISGLAYGIDKASHELSLEAKGKTVAVLAGGLDRIYPTTHQNLADKILENGGLLLSEYPPTSPAIAFKFPIRNRIVAGLSPVTLIVEAGLPSGSLISAKSALDNNREVWAIPTTITGTMQGTNYLIEQGARLIYRAEQIAEYYGIDLEAREHVAVDKEGQRILDLLKEGTKTFDELVGDLNLPVDEVLSNLTQLELDGLVYQPLTNQYKIK